MVAGVGDAHTFLNAPYKYTYLPGGIPLSLGVVEQSLYVRGAYQKELAGLIGARLVAVEGVPVRELMRRRRQVVGGGNEYLLLRNLAYDGYLFHRCLMEDVLPEWKHIILLVLHFKAYL